MVAAHEVSHIPFRPWCAFCVRGRGRSCGHPRVSHEGEAILVISIEYMFGGSVDATANELPILVARDRWSTAVWAHPVPSKRVVHRHGTRCLVAVLNETGYKRLVLKSDQEPAIRALCGAAKAAFEGNVIPEASPRENRGKTNGEAEAAVKQVHGMIRNTVWYGFCVKLSSSISGQSCRGTTRCSLGRACRNPPRPLQSGSGWVRSVPPPPREALGRVALPCFGETIELQRTQNKLEGRWRPGVFLGVRRTTTENILADANGACLALSVRRFDEGSRWGPGLVKSARSTPWSPRPAEEDGVALGELPLPITVCPELLEHPARRPEDQSREPAARRLYLMRRSFERHGYTASRTQKLAAREDGGGHGRRSH